MRKKRTTNEYRYFFESNFVGVIRLFVLIYSNQDNNSKRHNAKRYYLPKGIAKNYSIIIWEKRLLSSYKKGEKRLKVRLLDVCITKNYSTIIWEKRLLSSYKKEWKKVEG